MVDKSEKVCLKKKNVFSHFWLLFLLVSLDSKNEIGLQKTQSTCTLTWSELKLSIWPSLVIWLNYVYTRMKFNMFKDTSTFHLTQSDSPYLSDTVITSPLSGFQNKMRTEWQTV